mmetsp:Transcript_30995/g.92070  ORF Transcript_30995/g.92070 Transcript_30995/m.92070 type:complete len:293 (+) Transcript_30995:2911-3789(+)
MCFSPTSSRSRSRLEFMAPAVQARKRRRSCCRGRCAVSCQRRSTCSRPFAASTRPMAARSCFPPALHLRRMSSTFWWRSRRSLSPRLVLTTTLQASRKFARRSSSTSAWTRLKLRLTQTRARKPCFSDLSVLSSSLKSLVPSMKAAKAIFTTRQSCDSLLRLTRAMRRRTMRVSTQCRCQARSASTAVSSVCSFRFPSATMWVTSSRESVIFSMRNIAQEIFQSTMQLRSMMWRAWSFQTRVMAFTTVSRFRSDASTACSFSWTRWPSRPLATSSPQQRIESCSRARFERLS